MWGNDPIAYLKSTGTLETYENIAFPKGFSPKNVSHKKQAKDANHGKEEKSAEDAVRQMNDLKLKKAWAISYAGMKQLPMNAFMMWMSGSSIQIFSIMITAMMFWNGIAGLVATNQRLDTFAPGTGESTAPKTKFFLSIFDHPTLIKPKLVYIFFQLVQIGLGLYKCSSMGLLPTTSSDWLWQVSAPNHKESVILV